MISNFLMWIFVMMTLSHHYFIITNAQLNIDSSSNRSISKNNNLSQQQLFTRFSTNMIKIKTFSPSLSSLLKTDPQNDKLKINKRSTIPQEEIDILPAHYYRDIAPVVEPGKPVIVNVSVVILSMKVSSGSDQVFNDNSLYSLSFLIYFYYFKFADIRCRHILS